jgi:hypothetical protein
MYLCHACMMTDRFLRIPLFAYPDMCLPEVLNLILDDYRTSCTFEYHGTRTYLENKNNLAQ